MFSSIQEAINDIESGKLVIVVDDEDRENEGDFITAAANITPEIVNFLITEGRGLLCVALTAERASKLELQPMVIRNTDTYTTNFTVSVDFKSDHTTTGISAYDRASTIIALQDDNAEPINFSRPGHIFPLIAKEGGVIQRQGHTEAAVDLARLAGRGNIGVLIEIMNPDGSMARVDDLIKVAQKFNLKIITIEDLKNYREINKC